MCEGLYEGGVWKIKVELFFFFFNLGVYQAEAQTNLQGEVQPTDGPSLRVFKWALKHRLISAWPGVEVNLRGRFELVAIRTIASRLTPLDHQRRVSKSNFLKLILTNLLLLVSLTRSITPTLMNRKSHKTIPLSSSLHCITRATLIYLKLYMLLMFLWQFRRSMLRCNKSFSGCMNSYLRVWCKGVDIRKETPTQKNSLSSL